MLDPEVKCNVCSDTGEIECQYCDDGDEECTDCQGEGTVDGEPCEMCLDTGYTDCMECDGNGYNYCPECQF